MNLWWLWNCNWLMLCHLLSNLLLLPIFVSSIFIYIISSSLSVYCFQCLHTTDFWYNQHPCHPFSYRASGILASSLERRVAQSVLCLRSEFQPALSSTFSLWFSFRRASYASWEFRIMFVLIWHMVFRSCELILKHLPRGAIIVEVVDCIRAYQGFLSIVRCHWVLPPPPP